MLRSETKWNDEEKPTRNEISLLLLLAQPPSPPLYCVIQVFLCMQSMNNFRLMKKKHHSNILLVLNAWNHAASECLLFIFNNCSDVFPYSCTRAHVCVCFHSLYIRWSRIFPFWKSIFSSSSVKYRQKHERKLEHLLRREFYFIDAKKWRSICGFISCKSANHHRGTGWSSFFFCFFSAWSSFFCVHFCVLVGCFFCFRISLDMQYSHFECFFHPGGVTHIRMTTARVANGFWRCRPKSTIYYFEIAVSFALSLSLFFFSVCLRELCGSALFLISSSANTRAIMIAFNSISVQ